MSNKKQTAVEWLAEEIYKWENGLSIMTAIEIVKQAKELEKQQVDDYAIDFKNWCDKIFIEEWISKTTEQLLEEFKKENSL